MENRTRKLFLIIYIIIASTCIDVNATENFGEHSISTVKINENDIIYDHEFTLLETKRGIVPLFGTFWQDNELYGVIGFDEE